MTINCNRQTHDDQLRLEYAESATLGQETLRNPFLQFGSIYILFADI
jgi:hypothetical protein